MGNKGIKNYDDNFFESMNKKLNGQNKDDGRVNRASFEYISIIGKGGYGRVWKALMKKKNKCYALKEMSKAKIIDKKSIGSIIFERNLLSEMNHP
jgi:serine/threonine kinase 32